MQDFYMALKCFPLHDTHKYAAHIRRACPKSDETHADTRARSALSHVLTRLP